jgi:hypothetical protein
MSVCAAALLPVCVPCRARAQAAGSPQETVFFSFDDGSIPWRANLKLTLERPQKHPANPVLRAGPPGSVDANGTILYGTVFKDGDKFRMWYLAWPLPDKGYPQQTLWPRRPVAYAESPDRIHWENIEP